MQTSQQATESRAARSIREIFDSGRPLVYIRSSEEQRLTSLLGGMGLPVWTWSVTEGMRGEGGIAQPGTQAPRAALDFIIAHEGQAIFHLKDFHEALRDSAEVRRRVRDVHQACLKRRKYVVITSPVRLVPEEIQRSVAFLELRPPDSVELIDFLRVELRGSGAENNEQALRDVAGALRG